MADVEQLIQDHCSSKDLQIHEQAYNLELKKGKPTQTTAFNYATFLVRSQYPADIKKGISLLESMYKDEKLTGKRDFIYYTIIGYARLKDYDSAVHYAEGLLKVEPNNRQVKSIHDYVQKLKKKEQTKEAAVTGGLLVLVGGLVGFGLAALARK